jgi:hypothetical protein
MEMLAKCANDSCFAPFRQLAEGRLFRLESDSPPGSSTFNRVEHFWLCPHCSSIMTLHLKEDGTVGTVELPEAIRGVRNGVVFTSAHRKSGLVLRSISYPSPHRAEDWTSRRPEKMGAAPHN